MGGYFLLPTSEAIFQGICTTLEFTMIYDRPRQKVLGSNKNPRQLHKVGKKKDLCRFRSKWLVPAYLYEKTTWKNTQNFYSTTSGRGEPACWRWIGDPSSHPSSPKPSKVNRGGSKYILLCWRAIDVPLTRRWRELFIPLESHENVDVGCTQNFWIRRVLAENDAFVFDP